MTLLPRGLKVHLALGYTDMRKGMDGLAMLVQGVLRQDPFSGHLFVFRGRKADLIKIVFWDGTRACRRAIRPRRHTMSVRSLRHIGRDFPTICRAKISPSILMSASAPAAAARSMSSARRSARCSTSCRHSFGCCVFAVPNTVAAPAGRSTRLLRLSVPSPREWRARHCWRMC